MRITLSQTQQATLLEWAGNITRAEVAADCKPSGYQLCISISSIGAEAEAIRGSSRIDLGDVDVLIE